MFVYIFPISFILAYLKVGPHLKRSPFSPLSIAFYSGHSKRKKKVVCFCTEYFPIRLIRDKGKFVTLKLLSGQKTD